MYLACRLRIMCTISMPDKIIAAARAGLALRLKRHDS